MFSLAPHASVFPWDQGSLCGRWNHCTMLLGCLFSFLKKVSGQQTLYECIKNDFFKICCSHPCFKENQVQKIKLSWIPKFLPSIYSSNFSLFFERERFLYENFFCPFYSPILPFHLDSSKARIKKMHEQNKGAFDMVYTEM